MYVQPTIDVRGDLTTAVEPLRATRDIGDDAGGLAGVLGLAAAGRQASPAADEETRGLGP